MSGVSKVTLNQGLRKDLKHKLFEVVFGKQTERLVKEIEDFSKEVYNNRVTPELKKLMSDLDEKTNTHWFNTRSNVWVDFPEGVTSISVNLYKSDSFENIMLYNSSGSKLSGDNLSQTRLYFPDGSKVPFHGESEFFRLTKEEFEKYSKIVKRHARQRKEKTQQILVGFGIIDKMKTFEELFSQWSASEKIFKSIYLDRKAELESLKKEKLLPISADFENLNKTLELE